MSSPLLLHQYGIALRAARLLLGANATAAKHAAAVAGTAASGSQQLGMPGQQQGLRTLAHPLALVPSTSAAGTSLLVSFSIPGARAMAGAASDAQTNENTWAVFRSKNAVEKRNDLNNAMYAMMLVFGFCGLAEDYYQFPPRVIAMSALIFLVLYVRKH